MATLLEVRNLRAGYGAAKVLHGLAFSLEEGGIAAILGANGAGKTTILRALCNMIPMSGEITLADERIEKLSTEDIVRRRVAHVPDGRGTFVHLTVEENLQLGAYTRRDRPAVAAGMEAVYGYFPRLAERRRQQAGTLSGGEQQMLAISRALMLQPRLLLLDEPSFGLAPLIVEEIFAIMQTINREQRVAILLVEQNASLALALASHAYVIETGRVVVSGAADDIRKDETVRRSYLGY
jgi:branched-chain amino acid transport system ATP-binding protein